MSKTESQSAPRPFERSFLLGGLTSTDQAWLAEQLGGLAGIHYAPGEKIIHEGMPAMGFYLIGEGSSR